MLELVEYIARELVENPDSVKVTSSDDGEGNIKIHLRVHPDDMGKVIGKQGRIAKSIRSILKAISLKQNCRINLEIEDTYWMTKL